MLPGVYSIVVPISKVVSGAGVVSITVVSAAVVVDAVEDVVVDAVEDADKDCALIMFPCRLIVAIRMNCLTAKTIHPFRTCG